MKKACIRNVFACTGAVIGAGFASGREIVSFFTRYGEQAWWMMFLSAALMAVLCWLVVRRQAIEEKDWCSLFADEPRWMQEAVRICSLGLMILTGGAMLSAGGHMVALVWNHPWAAGAGTLGTLAAAWAACRRDMRPLGWLSAVLAVFFLETALVIWRLVPVASAVQVPSVLSGGDLIRGALYAMGYAGMNMTLAIGVIHRSRQAESRENMHLSICFGAVMFCLLAVGNALFFRYPACQDSAFPMIWLLRSLGRTGYLAGAALLYLAILTTLTAVLYAVRTSLEAVISRKRIAAIAALGGLLAVSGIGFDGIVDNLYAPAGLACLLLVFVPLLPRRA